MRRSKLEMYIAILQACGNKTRITRMTYATNINAGYLKKLLVDLETKGYIEKISLKSQSLWVMTFKGRNALRIFSDTFEDLLT